MTLRFADPAERDDLGAFTARVVRLDSAARVRLRYHAALGRVTAWAQTPFDVLATRSVTAALDPADVTLPASALLTALAVQQAEEVSVDGTGGLWAAQLPPEEGWVWVEDVPAAELEALTDKGLELARDNAGPHGLPASLLEHTVLTASNPQVKGMVKVPMRALFALSGMGFLGGGEPGPEPVVRVSATGSWLRLDARFGAVVRRRVLSLPLL